MKDFFVAEAIAMEEARQRENLEMIASENYVSREVLDAQGSVLTNKYAEGYPFARYYGGCHNVDMVESIARERAARIFNAQHVNVQPHSGSQANMAAYMALLNLGDTILAPSMNGGGHLTHSSPVSFVSKLYKVRTYDVSEYGWYDYDAIQRRAMEVQPRLIVAGASAYPRIIDFQRFRQIADSVGAYLMVDMAHIAGLVAAGVHPSPVPYADIVTTTTHKTLRGPRGGMILCREDYKTAVDSAVFPRTQGGPLEHVIAAKAVCLFEAMDGRFQEYGKQVVKNAKALAQGLKENGLDLVTGGTDNHLLLIDLRNTHYNGKEAENLLDGAHITVNKNMIPGDTRSPREASGIRLGTAALTSRGMKEAEMRQIATWIADVLFNRETNAEIGKQVLEFARPYPFREDEEET